MIIENYILWKIEPKDVIKRTVVIPEKIALIKRDAFSELHDPVNIVIRKTLINIPDYLCENSKVARIYVDVKTDAAFQEVKKSINEEFHSKLVHLNRQPVITNEVCSKNQALTESEAVLDETSAIPAEPADPVQRASSESQTVLDKAPAIPAEPADFVQRASSESQTVLDKAPAIHEPIESQTLLDETSDIPAEPADLVQPASSALIDDLKKYIEDRKKNTKKLYTGRRILSAIGLFGSQDAYTGKSKIGAALALINCLEVGQKLPLQHLKPLKEGRLGKIVKTFDKHLLFKILETKKEHNLAPSQ